MTEMTIIDAIGDPDLFGPWFRKPETWAAWLTFLKVLFGLELSAADLATFQQCTGRSDPPEGSVNEAWLVVGRRGGKSLILALIAVFLAMRDWSGYLTPGERGTIMIIAADRRQARTIFRYVTALLKNTILAELVERETADALDLNNGVTIEILTASFRTVRGYSLIACLADEIAFWRSDESGANPDREILAAIRPAMATIPGAMLLCASSPYARRGALWDAYRRHYGKPGPVLVWRAPTRTMNATVPQSVIDDAIEADPASAAAEFGAQFRTDVETFVSREVVEAAVVPGRHELPPMSDASYVAFTDPAGGSGSDSMTLAIAHRDQSDRIVLNAIRERKPPFSPVDTVAEFAGLLKAYRVNRIVGDHWGGEFVRELFRTHGVQYLVSEKSKSEIYRDALALLNSGKIDLLDHQRLASQVCVLERRTARGGRNSIDHPPGAHDDLANAALGALLLANVGRPRHHWVGVQIGPARGTFTIPEHLR